MLVTDHSKLPDSLIVHAPSPITINEHLGLGLSYVYEEKNTDNKVTESIDNKDIPNSNFKINSKSIPVKKF